MPLVRRRNEILSTMLGVKFLLADGDNEISCRVNISALRSRFGSSSAKEDVSAFLLHREEIEAIARLKYERGEIEPHLDAKVVISGDELASPLLRRMMGCA